MNTAAKSSSGTGQMSPTTETLEMFPHWITTFSQPARRASRFPLPGSAEARQMTGDLWPSVLRIVRRDNPDWALIENVVNLKNMGLAAWRDDLAKAGYLTEVFDIPACAVGLPTVERHLWIVAQSRSLKLERGCEKRLPDINELQQCKRREAGSETPQRPYRPSLPRCRLHRSRKGIPNFVERIRGIGNAINPQVAYQIMRHMK